MVNVVIGTSLSEEQVRKICEVSTRLHVEDAAALFLGEMPDALRPGQQPAPKRTARSLAALLAEAEVLLSPRVLPVDLVARAPTLRWVQLPMAGAEWVQGTDLWEAPHVIVTSARGINARPVAEWAFMAMMAFVKDTRTLFRNQEQGRWERWSLGQLRGKTIGVVGFGAVGHELARLAQAFEMELLLCNRSRPREESLPMRSYFPLSRLRDFLGQCDYVVASVALTKETERLFTEAEFRAMKPSAIFLNVARGGVADESALVQALQQGWIAGAALDVFQQEPLPVDSPLWKMTNVLISPHIAGLFEGYDEAVTRLFCQNLHRYLNGEPLLNVVERGRPL